LLGVEEVPMAEPAYRLKFPETQDGRAWPAQGEWTYKDYLRLPDDGRRYEVIRGALYVAPAPLIAHQLTVSQLTRLLGNFVVEHDLGMFLTATVDVLLPRDIASPVQPDLLFIRKERQPRGREGSFEGVPDLVIEVLSPSTRGVDETVKLAAYRDAGVPEYWMVDPQKRTVLVFGVGADGKSYVELQRAGTGETVRSTVLPGFEVAVNEICPAL
jgi:Uma2 family endonuclease